MDARRAVYRRRRPLAAVVIVVLLAVTASIVWVNLFQKAGDVNASVSCPVGSGAPAVARQLTPLSYDGLNDITPAAPAASSVHVLNAGGQRGLATQVSLDLEKLGFTQAASPTNDPLYPRQDMKCVGQIRFGSNGVAAARTLSLVAPCTQLVRDNRQDSSVDLVLGQYFSQVAPNSATLSVLHQLTDWAQAHPQSSGGLLAHDDLAPQVSSTLLAQAHPTTC
ncbi:MAG TPA: envelope integrity protein Cei [Pseudonocardiaceae bacterium]